MTAPWFTAFAERVAAGDPTYRRCAACGGAGLPPRRTCPDCGAPDMEDAPLSTTGRVETYTEVHVTTPRFSGETPYTVVLAGFPEGVRLTGQLRGASEIDRDDRVTLDAEERDDGWLLIFSPSATD